MYIQQEHIEEVNLGETMFNKLFVISVKHQSNMNIFLFYAQVLVFTVSCAQFLFPCYYSNVLKSPLRSASAAGFRRPKQHMNLAHVKGPSHSCYNESGEYLKKH